MVMQTAGYAGTAAHGGIPLERPSGETEAEKVLTGPPLTKGYKPSIPAAMFITTRGQSYLPSMLADVELMLLHPCVVAPYSYYRSAIASVKFKIKASSSKVGEFVLAELQKFWTRCLSAVQDAYDYGWIAGELSYKYDKGLLGLYSLETFHPLDCWALTIDDNYVGVSVQNISGNAGRQSLWGPGKHPAKGFWFAHNRRWDRYYGRSQLYAAWRPWRRLGYRDGAEEVVDGGVYRFAYRGPIMRYPVRAFPRADGNGVDFDGAQSKAREFVENAKAGASVALPNTRDEKGNYEWEIDWPDHTIDVSSLVGYIEYLKKEVSLGVGVPPELLEASDTGSGWSGRKVPMLGFYQSQKKNAHAKVTAWKGQIGDPLVAWNFGPEAWFEVGVELVMPGGMSGEGDQPPAPGASPPPPGGGGGGENPLAGLMGGGGGEMSTLGGEPVNSLQTYALAAYNRTAQARRKRAKEKYELGIELADDGEEKATPFRTRRGTTGAKYKGKKYYGAEAEALLGRTQGKPQPKVRGARKKAALAEARKPKRPEQSGPGLQPMPAPTPSVADPATRAGEGTLKPRVPGVAPTAVAPQEEPSWMARAVKMVSEAFRKTWEKVKETTKGVKEKIRAKKERLKKEALTRLKHEYRNLKEISPGSIPYMEAVIELGAIARDYTPPSLVQRMRLETSEKNKVAKVNQAKKKAIAEGKPFGAEEEKKAREAKAEGIVAIIENSLEGISEFIDDALAMVDQSGTLGSWVEAIASGPVLTGLYVVTSGVRNPWGTMQAAWNTITHQTKDDDDRKKMRKRDLEDVRRFADLPEDDPEVKEVFINHYKARYPKDPDAEANALKQWDHNKDMRDRLRRERTNKQLGFDLAVDEEEGKLYPGLRHRIREVFTTTKDPDWAEALFFACLDMHRDDPAKAIEAVEEALEREPKQPPGTPEFEPQKWFGGMDDEDEGEGSGPDVDADEDSAVDTEPSPEAELATLAADSLWVLTRPSRVSPADLADLQARLRKATPDMRDEINRRVSVVLGKE